MSSANKGGCHCNSPLPAGGHPQRNLQARRHWRRSVSIGEVDCLYFGRNILCDVVGIVGVAKERFDALLHLHTSNLRWVIFRQGGTEHISRLVAFCDSAVDSFCPKSRGLTSSRRYFFATSC